MVFYCYIIFLLSSFISICLTIIISSGFMFNVRLKGIQVVDRMLQMLWSKFVSLVWSKQYILVLLLFQGKPNSTCPTNAIFRHQLFRHVAVGIRPRSKVNNLKKKIEERWSKLMAHSERKWIKVKEVNCRCKLLDTWNSTW